MQRNIFIFIMQARETYMYVWSAVPQNLAYIRILCRKLTQRLNQLYLTMKMKGKKSSEELVNTSSGPTHILSQHLDLSMYVALT